MSNVERQNNSLFTFETDGETVAQGLVGALVITDSGRFVISEVDYFFADGITRREFQDAKYSSPGTVTGSVFRGRLVFPNISVSNNDLIMPIEIQELSPEGKITNIKGPHKVGRALGIEMNQKYSLFIQDPYSRIFYLTTTIPEDEDSPLNNL
ncbi:MAG: hypothetical protein US96_C0007G0013 [Candidatus Woesebacteria bacterium GW2011_GWB1_38_5b]|uniref:Uncharacterized protein n=1 Tax=Candidatus Woesebacteria bacterium GW2011_GWB1_38_5b TaxID=1618569 RepID=A0A0G0KJI3_9BACT|nr:MAG: hypothetical protein US96_C0007G0013 [Candidatus Woesebacteria bacterium GW2011_GWB1_38_5b]